MFFNMDVNCRESQMKYCSIVHRAWSIGKVSYSKRNNKFLLPVLAKAIYRSFDKTESETSNIVNYRRKVWYVDMAIVLRLDRMMADRKISLNELADRVGIANVNLSKIKTGKVSAIRFSTLDAICDVLDCQPGDILEFQRDEKNKDEEQKAGIKKNNEGIGKN